MNILILLIGGNPLPNYIVSKYLNETNRPTNEREILPVPDRIILLHSKETAVFAEKLSREPALRDKCILGNLGDDERNTKKIKETLQEKLDKITVIETLHLNYTGGTKPMAVHSYLKTLASAKNLPKPPIFSYLDPERFKITLDDTDNSYPAVQDKDLRDETIVSVEKLFDIHLMAYKSGNTDLTYDTRTLEIEQFLKEMLPQILKDYPGSRTWVSKVQNVRDRFEEEKAKSRGRIKFYPKDKIKQQNKDLFPGITGELRSLNKLFPGDRFNVKSPDCEQQFSIFLEFFAGKWLEDVILHTLKGLYDADQIKYSDIKKSVEAEYNNRPCEMDVIVMKGYQMFLISCTMSKKIGVVKQKAFEAMYRAEQLGGEHAQVIVVSCLPDKPASYDRSKQNSLSKLLDDLQSFEAKFIKRCQLLGFDDLQDLQRLQQQLTQIIKR